MNIFEILGIGSNVRFGKGGPKLRVDSGGFEARDPSDSNFYPIRAIAPVGDADVSNKKYLETSADVRVTGQIDGNTPPAVVNGSVYICTITGGGYIEKYLYRGEEDEWIEYIPITGLSIKVTEALTGGNQEYNPNIYLWTTTWVDLGSAALVASGISAHEGTAGTHVIKDTLLSIVASGDVTKIFQFLASGIAHATTRILTIQDKDLTIAGTDDIAYHAANTGAHAIKDTSLNIEAAADATKKAHFLASGVTGGQNRALTIPDKDITIAGTVDVATKQTKFTPTAIKLVGDDGYQSSSWQNVRVDPTGGAFHFHFPIAPVDMDELRVTNEGNSVNAVTATQYAAETILGLTAVVLALPMGVWTFQYNAAKTNWTAL